MDQDYYETEPIEKLSEFISFVESLPKDFTLSRGQSRNYDLMPSALRLDNNRVRKYSRQSAQNFLNEFKIDAHNYLKFPADISTSYEWMVYAQHYGIPTRLLDFTYSHIISLMFAVEDAFEDEENNNCEVWFLNPFKLNNKNANRSEILNLSNIENNSLDEYDGPVVIKARKLNERINAQNGLFIYFQDAARPLNSLEDNEIIKKVVIKGEYKKRILSSLYSIGIGFTTLYPELQSVSKDIIMRESIQGYIEDQALQEEGEE